MTEQDQGDLLRALATEIDGQAVFLRHMQSIQAVKAAELGEFTESGSYAQGVALGYELSAEILERAAARYREQTKEES